MRRRHHDPSVLRSVAREALPPPSVPPRARRRWLVAAVGALVLGGASLVGATALRHGHRTPVRLRVGGAERVVWVDDGAPTVGVALRFADVTPHRGRLLSAGTHRVLAEQAEPVVTVDGVPATPSTRLRADDTLQVVQPGDVVEDVVEADEVIPAPPLPPTINQLWHPGVPGKVVHRKGAISGEVVGPDGQTVPPVPPRPVTEKLVALTFDDGPWPTTPVLLDELKAAQVPAMFCLIGRQLVTARLAAAQRALAEGHHVCNHTIDHDEHLATEPLDKVQLEVDQGDVFIRDRLKVQPTFFRPPGGSNGPMVEQVAAAHGEHVLMWTVDTQDYKTPGVAAIVARAVGGARPGAIILLHDGGGDRAQTYAAVPQIIQQLKAQGYTFVMPDQVPG